jgi:hypothetical protein
MRAEELTAQFGIAGILDFEEAEAGLAKAAISLDGMAGELYLQGAQLTAWQLPNERPVLFTSPRGTARSRNTAADMRAPPDGQDNSNIRPSMG